jgi:CRP-like cAMP-binding protein
MSKKPDALLKKLDILAEKIDILTMVTAITHQSQKLLEGKTQTEQIHILAKKKLPREVIALIVGTTPETVSVRLSEMKAEKQKEKAPKQEEKVQQNAEQKTV